ncbi:hypothetical protein BJ170DRAFT_564109, partial [Xylariales sp. AK1849]
DFELWCCLLQHLQRTQGDLGVLKLWKALWGRKSLYQIKNRPAKIFWQTILEAALRLNNDKFLDGIWIYAEWMSEIHNAEWPDLYTTVVPFFLRTHQHEKAVRWHLRITPNFYPGSREFIDMMQNFSTDRVLAASFTLQSLYIASPERRLYDALVPYLYSRGQSRLALLWRRICVQHDDGPRLHTPARQFLRYLRGYIENVQLHPREIVAVGDADSVSTEEEEQQQLEVSREFINRVHGKTFGLSAKTYNDRLGSRWFASSWVGLDTAISIISALGIREIGPLSLQSISLREGTPDGVLSRISQLRGLGISIPDSGYANTIEHFAKSGDDELLTSFLHCDLHPDVFDDMQLQSNLMDSSTASGDWGMYTLLLASRLAFIEKATRTAANALLQTYLLQNDLRGVLRVLDDMQATQIGLNVDQSRIMFHHILSNLTWHQDSKEPLEALPFCLAVCRRLSSMDVPIPIVCWRKLVYCTARNGDLIELNDIVRELVEYYTVRQSARPGFMPVHLNDVPESLTKPLEGVDNLFGLYLPLDMPGFVAMHPLNQLFNPRWQGDFIRWSFSQLHSLKRAAPLLGQGQDRTRVTQLGQAISILRKLKDVGVNIEVGKVQKSLQLRLAELYGVAPPTKAKHDGARRSNVFSLGQMKALCDEAWGGELLPPLKELREQIAAVDVKRWERFEKM